MQKMRIKDGKEWFDNYTFLAFGLATEQMDGQPSIYNVVICKDDEGFIEEVPLNRVQFYE